MVVDATRMKTPLQVSARRAHAFSLSALRGHVNSIFSYFAGHLGYPDTEYEYFEQRGGLARPNYLSATPMVPTMGPGAPLLPTETAKIDSRHEEVSFLAKKRSKRLLKSITDGTYLEVIALDPGN